LFFSLPTKTMYTFLFSPICVTCPAHLHELITQITACDEYNHKAPCNVISSSPVTLSLLGLNTFLSTLFSNTLSLCSSLKVTDQVSHPYKTTEKICPSHFSVLYILDLMAAGIL
jgi:hypothetical protein